MNNDTPVVAGDGDLLNSLRDQRNAEELGKLNSTDEAADETEGEPSASDSPADDEEPEVNIEAGLTGDDLFSILGETSPVYEPVVVYLKGRAFEYHIKKHSPKDCNIIDAKMERGENRAIAMREPDSQQTYAEAVAVAESVFVKTGETYKRAFTIEQLVGREEKKDKSKKVIVPRIVGLFERTGEEGLFAQSLKANVFSINQSINPSLKKLAKAMMEDSVAIAHMAG